MDMSIKRIDDREFKGQGEPTFNFSLQASVVGVNGITPIDTTRLDNEVLFCQNFKYWNDQVSCLSVNNFDNSYFERIVEMGKDAVPFILAEMKKGPTPLVYALDRIFPDTIEYQGYVSLETACNTWISILE